MINLTRHIQGLKPSLRGYVRIECPFCIASGHQTNHKNLSINVHTNRYRCHRCGTSGSGNNFEYEFVPDVSDLKSRLAGTASSDNFDIDEFSVPIDCNQTPFAYRYLTTVRGLTDDLIEKYSIRSGINVQKDNYVSRKWSGRIIFPFYKNSRAVYAVGRTYIGKEPKYLNSSGTKNAVVYGIDEVDGTCILCEGILSAIAAQRYTGVPAISVLGKVISDTQLSLIRDRADTIYISFDGTQDVTDDFIRHLSYKFWAAGFTVFELHLPTGKDPDDLGPEYKNYFDKAISPWNIKRNL